MKVLLSVSPSRRLVCHLQLIVAHSIQSTDPHPRSVFVCSSSSACTLVSHHWIHSVSLCICSTRLISCRDHNRLRSLLYGFRLKARTTSYSCTPPETVFTSIGECILNAIIRTALLIFPSHWAPIVLLRFHGYVM